MGLQFRCSFHVVGSVIVVCTQCSISYMLSSILYSVVGIVMLHICHESPLYVDSCARIVDCNGRWVL
jgi:hypothetical protein